MEELKLTDIATNSKQTTMTESLLDSLDKEVKADLVDYIGSVPLIEWMISTRRGKAIDRPKDEDGKIIVDISKPHMLEDMDYFRPAAIHYEEHGCYTELYPNKHPRSKYAKFWKEQARRCRDGYVRESDGEWITGDFYFYLNFSPIMLSKKDAKKAKRADRISGFPRVYDGDYMYYHYLEQARDEGKHAMLLKSRGKGFSFKGGSGLGKLFILGDSEEASVKQKGFAIADDTEYLKKDGILNKFLDVADFCADHTPWPRARLKQDWSTMNWRMGYEDPNTGRQKGVLNEIMGVTVKNDPQRARGKRGAKIYWEEIGKFRGFLQSWGIARPSVEEGSYAFGTMIGWGTGGTEGADFSGAELMFYNPEGYNVKEIPNVYDKGDGSNYCAFFFGEYLNRLGHYDKDGNSDVVGALIELLTMRARIRKKTSDPHALTQEKAERPITPQEAMMRREGTVFPVTDIKERLAEIQPRIKSFTSPHWVGDIKIGENGVYSYSAVEGIKPIRDFPLKDEAYKEGAVEIFAHPVKDANGQPYSHRYIAGIDPVDDDYSTTSSLFSISIMDLWTDRVVAVWTGRFRKAEDNYMRAYKMIKYYNAVANYENAWKGFYVFMRNMNAVHMLCDTPEILKSMDYVKAPTSGNKSKGTPGNSKHINALGRRLQADWLISKPEYNSGEEEGEEELLNLHYERDIAYLQEAASWNPDGNFDRVSGRNMLFILREEMKNRVAKGQEQVDEAADDDFWDKLYYGKGFKSKKILKGSEDR